MKAQITATKPDRYKVMRVFRVSARRQLIEKNLTLDEARRLVNSFPDSQRSMVVYFKQ